MTKIKLCGLKRIEDIEYVNKYQPDYIGFVFAKSSRFINDTLAFQLKSRLDERIQAVGVFVNEPMEHIISLCRNKVIDAVQLHGDEDEAYMRKLKGFISNSIIKAIRVQSRDQIEAAQNLSCDYLLLDTYQKAQYGGSGIAFDHSVIPKSCKPFFLAGGLNKENIVKAIKDSNPYCIDVSSGVETDGVKDEGKIKEIIDMVRNL
jgi:phosphoribosylanthranilate isomerase